MDNYKNALECFKSESKNNDLFKEKNKIVYINNHGNLGIATALNNGCKAAIKDGFEWSLTMDQDSKVTQFNERILKQLSSIKNAGLYYPTYIINGEKYEYKILENNEPVIVMSSGNIINLAAYKEIGGFEDKLFIDYVDFDYCIKLKQHGYNIEEAEGFTLQHELGKSFTKKNRFFKLMITNHPVIRRYYITRNKLYMLEKYKKFAPFYDNEKNTIVKEIVKIIFFEDQKIDKLKIMYTAYKDFRRNIFGKKIL